ncbi:short-chain collagen C4-like [Strongylocentrotus purpuratus]|uniref:Short-chain collagen C4 n=1 Tax=Strongylocentrotus purpuratus TaxID=7668 RepID=A0A7M7T1W0_STRPU|nr:short-chain collagen C4-like [Strongylocentrotus purpuratus]
MKSFFVVTLVLFSCLCLVGVTQAVAVSKEGTQDEAFAPENIVDSGKLTQTEEDKISEIRKQVLFLQESVAEITRSFSTLELVAKNPSMMAKIHIADSLETEFELGEPEKTRRRRELDPLPSSGAQQQSVVQNIFGPYSWPTFSGQCFMCPTGVPGQQGPPGPQGTAGRDGRDGRDAPESPQAQETPTESCDDAVVRPVGNMTSLPGVIYIRWGNDVCPEDAELIYSGTIGGAHYTHSGSGSNYLCMPEEPIYDEFIASIDVYRAILYSSEYEVNTGPSRMQPKHDQTPTCAVCRAPSGRTSKLMIPARNVCPSQEWRLEYAGYLMAEYNGHQKSEFVCVDREMVSKSGTGGNQNGAVMYFTEVRCVAGDGLDCGSYIDGYELTCAVCTI